MLPCRLDRPALFHLQLAVLSVLASVLSELHPLIASIIVILETYAKWLIRKLF